MSEFLSQADLANRLVQKSGVDPEVAKKFATLFFTIVKNGLKDTESLTVHNFGTFKKTWIESTMALNPQTGEKIEVPAHWRIKFVPCAAVARRINKPYAKLKPKLIKESKKKDEDDEPIPEPEIVEVPPVEDEDDTDLQTAETTRAEEAEQAAQEEEVTAEDIVDEKADEQEEEAEENGKKPYKLFALIGAGLLLLILLIVLLARSCSTDSSVAPTKEAAPVVETPVQKEEPPAPVEEEKPAPAPRKAPEKKPEPKPVPAPKAPAATAAETYTVPAGSSYHKIAEEKYNNRHLWPLVYSANKDANPDPDMVAAQTKVQIPSHPDGEAGNDAVSKALIDAYDGYISVIEKQPESTKNALRTNRAVRVLVSGELLQSGFISANESHFQSDHVAEARKVLKTQYK